MIPKNTDLRHIETGLSEAEKRAARIEGIRQKSLTFLGEKWVCSRANAPRRGTYNPITGARLA